VVGLVPPSNVINMMGQSHPLMYMRSIYHTSFMYLDKPDGMSYMNSSITYSLHSNLTLSR
ncbi:MAG: hypothetical protein AAB116_01475, partial [Candidatus Poribacteria bacterium]